MEIEPEVPKHDRTPNLKLVMNPEGKMHDWTDLPDEEVPEMSQMVMVGNPEIAKTLVNNLNDCKGRGKVEHPQQVSGHSFKVAAPSFAGSFRQVFNSRRGMFEQTVAGTRPNINTLHTHHQLARSKTLPDMNVESEEEDQKYAHSLKRPCIPSSPLVPKRTSSKQMVAMMSDGNRRPLRSFFSNA